MKAKKIKQEDDTSTEEKIKNAARTVFLQKGFAATRTRDIAEEAGINLALLNYYFRSKQKLFQLIMMESMQGLLKTIRLVFNDDTTTLDQKIEMLVSSYIELLTTQPDIPLFLLSELRSNPDMLVSKLDMKDVLMKSVFMKQLQQEIKAGKIAPIHPLQFMMNLMGMTILPFVANPIVKQLGNLSQQEFNDMMAQRKTLIPQWFKATLKVK
jgi:AcrR family transcriptional regulator